ncbi:LamG-like jellyroll fold domain-containing protein [Acinetobacter sp.]|uniref:LamG-like jellyroll fold domain-containing protein n=1 Tax=Acinetobacter sp. TaxID=472 RepID=UPI000C08F945|nr:LamG-like jellyroll fold domain-containing protein [Acinetobacter sp.]MAK31346.1 hypothetical protein [Acinetobacter sp.]
MRKRGPSLLLPEHYPAGAHIVMDGVSEYVQIDAAAALIDFNDQPHTIAIWFKVADITGDTVGEALFGFGNTDASSRYWATINDSGSLVLYGLADSSTFLWGAAGKVVGSGLDDDEWHVVIVTYNGSDTLTAYIDGATGVTQAVGSGDLQGTVGAMGALRYNSGVAAKWFSGKVASFAMFDRVLDAGEMDVLERQTPLADIRNMRPQVWLWCGDKDVITDMRNHGLLALTPAMQNAEAEDIAAGSP